MSCFIIIGIMAHLLQQVFSKLKLLENSYPIRWFRIKSSFPFNILERGGGPKIRRHGAALGVDAAAHFGRQMPLDRHFDCGCGLIISWKVPDGLGHLHLRAVAAVAP
jgi:hypothetical protein